MSAEQTLREMSLEEFFSPRPGIFFGERDIDHRTFVDCLLLSAPDNGGSSDISSCDIVTLQSNMLNRDVLAVRFSAGKDKLIRQCCTLNQLREHLTRQWDGGFGLLACRGNNFFYMFVAGCLYTVKVSWLKSGSWLVHAFEWNAHVPQMYKGDRVFFNQ